MYAFVNYNIVKQLCESIDCTAIAVNTKICHTVWNHWSCWS